MLGPELLALSICLCARSSASMSGQRHSMKSFI